MTEKKEYISHGASFSGILSWIGLGIFVLSIYLLFEGVFFIIPLAAIYTGINLFLSFKGIEIDYGNKKIREVLYLFPFKTGTWQELTGYDHLMLTNNNEAFKIIMPAHPLIQRDINIKSYDVFLIDTENGKKLMLVSCKTIAQAQKKLAEYSGKLELPGNDMIKKTWDKYRIRREGRNRIRPA